MNTKYDVRIAAKHDVAENWESIENTFVPMDGEIIVYHDVSVPYNSNGEIVLGAKDTKIKIGDGTSFLSELDFVYQGLEAMVLNHVTNVQMHITSEERTKINQSITAKVEPIVGRNTYRLILSTDTH